MLRQVTAGVDGSADSLAAAHWAAREALRRGAALRLVHAWTWHPRPAPSVPAGTSERDWAEQTLDRAVGSVRAAHSGLRIVAGLVPGSAVDALLTAAAEAELLVLGSSGLSGLSGVAGVAVGSVSQRVVAGSPHPVVLVRAGATSADEHLPVSDGVSPEEIPETPYRDVVLGLDTRRPRDELIEFAFEAARLRAAGLRVVRAFGVPSAEGAGPRTDLLRPWREKFPGVPVTEIVCEGRAATALVRASSGASLVVVGRRTRDGRLGMRIGPVTQAVLHHAACPVAVVPHA
ncbi:universal stress protein [Streptomyces sp. KM273126]|uniref:universal stress protein n=1 Tax=Streptomyces sp. KM273126 TaxID=2545247 RepID=UPI001038DFEE|nr:universal stress protein [Streptomyces sp. KM273126]MBA2810630.1 universal stress protein [Streptomyces sp. KM273126]